MSHSGNHSSRSRKPLFLLILLLVGASGVFFWFFGTSESGSANDEVVESSDASSVMESGGNAKTTMESSDSEQASDENDVGSLIGDTSLSDTELVKRLSVIVLKRSAPDDSRSEALTHLLNLTTEENESVLFVLARSSNLSEDLGDDLFKDALNRSLSTQADLSLIFLERKEESLRKEAQEHLAFLLDEDLGSKASAWRSAVDAAKVRWKAEASE